MALVTRTLIYLRLFISLYVYYVIYIYVYTYILVSIYLGVSINGVPKNSWFTMETPLKRMIWGYPYFRKPIYIYILIRNYIYIYITHYDAFDNIRSIPIHNGISLDIMGYA